MKEKVHGCCSENNPRRTSCAHLSERASKTTLTGDMWTSARCGSVHFKMPNWRLMSEALSPSETFRKYIDVDFFESFENIPV
jgi:hypothetical protein